MVKNGQSGNLKLLIYPNNLNPPRGGRGGIETNKDI